MRSLGVPSTLRTQQSWSISFSPCKVREGEQEMKDYNQASIASFPDHSAIQFLQKRSARPGNIFHAYLDRRRGGKGARPNNDLEAFLFAMFI